MPVEDLAGFGKATEKLIEEVSKAIGSLFRPSAIRREGDAEASKLLAIAEATSQAAAKKELVDTVTRLAKINLLASGNQELVERARLRLLQQEVEGQRNVEAIADKAVPLLARSVSAGSSLEDDWRRRFFRYAEDVSSESMQQLWAQILAGEIASSRSYALKTLDVLRSLGTAEADFFRKLCRLTLDNGIVIVPREDLNDGLVRFGLHYADIMRLRDFGLVHAGDNVSISLGEERNSAGLRYKGKVLWLSSDTSLKDRRILALSLTTAGRELSKLMPYEDPDLLYVDAVRKTLEAMGIGLKTASHGNAQDDFDVVYSPPDSSPDADFDLGYSSPDPTPDPPPREEGGR